MEIGLILAALAIPLWLNIAATLAVMRDSLSEQSQKIAQFILIWAIPILGAIIVLAVHRPKEKSSGKYPHDKDLGDDYTVSGSSIRNVKEGIDED